MVNVDPLENLLNELKSVRQKIFEIAKKSSGPVMQLARLVGGSVVPLLDQTVMELGSRAALADLRLQRLEAHVRIVDDGDVLEGLDMEPIEFINSVIMLTEVAKLAPDASETEVSELINAVQKTSLDWKDYLLTYTEEEPAEEDGAIEMESVTKGEEK